MRKLLLLPVAVAVLWAAPAAAHVTVQPNEATTGGFARFAVRVPNERDTAATVKVEIQLPEALESASFQPVTGWKRTVTGTTVVWEGGRIEPGEFQEFGFSVRMPEAPTTLVFPAVQTYDNGEVVRWIGPADADEPAARVTVSAVAEEEDAEEDEDDVPAVVPWVALALAAGALVVSLVSWRRRT